MADAKGNPFEMTQFGIFYPRGHLVVAFQNQEDARNAQKNLEDHTGLLARLGKSDEAVRTHLNAAPDDLSAERAMTVVRRVPFEFAHRYHRLAIQVLK